MKGSLHISPSSSGTEPLKDRFAEIHLKIFFTNRSIKKNKNYKLFYFALSYFATLYILPSNHELFLLCFSDFSLAFSSPLSLFKRKHLTKISSKKLELTSENKGTLRALASRVFTCWDCAESSLQQKEIIY